MFANSGTRADDRHRDRQGMSTSVRGLLVAAAVMLPIAAVAQTAGAPLELEAKIPLGVVSGHIDHLAVDLKRQQLFVAELGN